MPNFSFLVTSNIMYLDPGSGSFILQLIIASLVGIMFSLRGFWAKLAGMFKKSSSETSDMDDDKQ